MSTNHHTPYQTNVTQFIASHMNAPLSELDAGIDKKLPAEQQALTCADAVTIDFAQGATAIMTFDRPSVAFTLSNLVNGEVYRLLLIQDGTGGRVATWVTTVHWEAKTVPILSTGASDKDIITFVKIGDIIYGGVSKNFGAVT